MSQITYSPRTGRPCTSGAPARQTWAVSDAVRVGFMPGLTVLERVPTPGDHAPDAWILQERGTNRLYRFVPHRGLSRCASISDARRA